MEDRDNSIESQKKAGVEFAKKNNFEFDIYADEGKSGYKIADADENDDMFKNRPSFTRLLNDIKEKKIDAIWVLNHSRLSRNQYGSAYIFRKLEKQKIKVYMGDTLYDYKNKESKFQRAIMDAFDEYDRERIVINTTRGLHFKIDKGERTFGKLYGYKRIGTTEKGLQKIKPVGSEIENIKYGYKRILEGATLRQLTLELYNKKSLDKTESMRISLKWHKILCHFSYTGYELNLKGLAVLKEFNNFEIDTVSMLNDTKYYTRSSNYKEKIISVENWIKTVERLHINRQVRLQYRTNKASKDMATGIIKCSECGQKYYSYIHDNKKGGKLYRYNYYKHYMAMNRKIHDCHQKKSFVSYNINEMLKIFYFFNYIMFDKTEERNKETLHLIKQE
jgi:DNA invertase Pin-like site-specific DNA recombinase